MALTVHSGSRIISQLMIDRAIASAPESNADWPVSADAEPDSPDACITVRDADAPDYYRLHPTGDVAGHGGFLLRVRAVTDGQANEKAVQIQDWMAKQVYQAGVTIDDVQYYIHCFGQFGNILPLGKDKNNTRRSVRTFNGVVSIVQL